jgi:hypothetical protein
VPRSVRKRIRAAAGIIRRGEGTKSFISAASAFCNGAGVIGDDPPGHLADTTIGQSGDVHVSGIRQTALQMQAQRNQSLVMLLGLDQAQTDAEADRWHRRGAVVMRAHDAGGCLRMATSVGPDHIVLDHRVPHRLVRLLKAHPVSSTAQIEWLPAVGSSQVYLAA